MFRSGKLDKFRLVQHCLLFTHLVTGILGSDDINSSDQNDQKRFINLSADCASLVPNGTIGVTLHTSEPFTGSLYSRDHPSSCKRVGDGGTSTKLVVTLGQDCGVQTISQRAGKLVAISDKENSVDFQKVHQISIYVQHDEHVQQVIDEQFLVQCWKGMAQGLVSYQDGFSNFVDKTLSRSMTAASTASSDSEAKPKPNVSSNSDQIKPNTSKLQKRILDIMVPMEPMTAAPSTSDLISIGDQNLDNLVDIGTPNIIESITMSGGNGNNPLHPKASGWMELIDDNGEALTDSTEVGTPVSLVIRIKQMASMDTMLSTCTAHSGDDFYDLTNFQGCTEDPDILPNFKAFFNSRTGVKRVTSNFPMFKFPDATKVIIRCTVVVCNKNCPVAKCDQEDGGSNPSSDFLDVNVLDKFYLDTFAQVHDSGMRLPPPILTSTGSTDSNQMILVSDDIIRGQQLMRPLRPEDQAVEFENNQNNYHKSQQQIESAASKAEEVIEAETEEENLLCLSPSRLALAFGILLVILLLALLASCVMWMRARSHLKRPKPSTLFASRPPRPPLPGPGALVSATAPPRGPFMIASRGAPYIRVVQ